VEPTLPIRLELAGHCIEAISVAGLETCIQLPGLDLCFDIGRCPPSSIARSTVLFTHPHIDHMGGMVMHCATRSLMNQKPPRYILPAQLLEPVEAMLESWRVLDGSELPCELIGAEIGDRVPLRTDLQAEVLRGYHPVTMHAYVLWKRHKKLAAHLQGASREQILQARARGEEVNEWSERPEIAFSGDSTIEILENEPSLRQARLLIMELTFLDDRVSVERARSRGHIHFDEVIERADLFENQAILFTHVSARYSAAEATRILDARMPEVLRDRVHLLPPLR
jgi:ribonuclease Z